MKFKTYIGTQGHIYLPMDVRETLGLKRSVAPNLPLTPKLRVQGFVQPNVVFIQIKEMTTTELKEALSTMVTEIEMQEQIVNLANQNKVKGPQVTK